MTTQYNVPQASADAAYQLGFSDRSTNLPVREFNDPDLFAHYMLGYNDGGPVPEPVVETPVETPPEPVPETPPAPETPSTDTPPEAPPVGDSTEEKHEGE